MQALMGKLLRLAALWTLALAPSASLAWRWRTMPHLGLHQDDALYLVGAKSLAEGHGYRIDSLPGAPFQTKYPPLLPLLLAPLWKFGPGFPANLKLATLAAWWLLPVFLLAVRAMCRQLGFSPRETWLLTLAAAWHPLVCLLSTAILSDLLFVALLMACLLLAERALDPGAHARLALAAGLVAGMACLTRTVGLPLALTAPLCFYRRGQGRKALLFLGGMLPAAGGWQAWSAMHQLHSRDPVLLYYTSYLGMERVIVHPENLPLVLWHNGDALLRSFGKLLAFDVALAQNVHLERILGVAAIAGAVRLARRTGRLQYPAAAMGIALLLLGHHFTADERLSLPVYPLILMGFWTEAKNLAVALRTTWNRRKVADRAVTVAAAAALAGLAGFGAATYAIGDAVFLPKLFTACQKDLQTRLPAYDWIRGHTAPDSTFYAYDDPALYLYTGRRALGLPMPPGRVYEGNAEREADAFIRAVPRQAREHSLDYLLVTTSDFYREHRAGLLWEIARRDPGLRLEYAAAEVRVYGCGPAGVIEKPDPADKNKGRSLPGAGSQWPQFVNRGSLCRSNSFSGTRRIGDGRGSRPERGWARRRNWCWSSVRWTWRPWTGFGRLIPRRTWSAAPPGAKSTAPPCGTIRSAARRWPSRGAASPPPAWCWPMPRRAMRPGRTWSGRSIRRTCDISSYWRMDCS